MSISSKLVDLANCKLAIKTAIEAKTPSIQPGNDLSAWPSAIGSIVQLKGETKTANPSTSQQIIVPSAGKNGITQLTLNPVTSSIDANIAAENIKKNISILGVTGTYEGSGGGGSGSINYVFETATVVNNTITLESFKALQYTASANGSLSVLAPSGTSTTVRDIVLVLDLTNATTFTLAWEASKFHPRVAAARDLACDVGKTNVYYINEFKQNHYVVARWIETTAATSGAS